MQVRGKAPFKNEDRQRHKLLAQTQARVLCNSSSIEIENRLD